MTQLYQAAILAFPGCFAKRKKLHFPSQAKMGAVVRVSASVFGHGGAQGRPRASVLDYPADQESRGLLQLVDRQESWLDAVCCSTVFLLV
jgi:hypothetical protein